MKNIISTPIFRSAGGSAPSGTNTSGTSASHDHRGAAPAKQTLPPTSHSTGAKALYQKLLKVMCCGAAGVAQVPGRGGRPVEVLSHETPQPLFLEGLSHLHGSKAGKEGLLNRPENEVSGSDQTLGIEPKKVAQQLVRGFHNLVAQKVYDEMLTSGIYWRRRKVTSITQLSQQNLNALKAKLGPLTLQEKAFCVAFLEKNFFAIHRTSDAALQKIVNERGDVSLRSKKYLDENSVLHHGHTHPEDVVRLHNHDFVFFFLQVGDLQNNAARLNNLGGNKLAFDLASEPFRQAFVSLDDMLVARRPEGDDLKHALGGAFEDSDVDVLDARRSLDKSPEGHVFHGKDIRQGLMYSLIHDLRTLSEESRTKLLNMRSDKEINMLVNSIFHPEVKVPRQLFTNSEGGRIITTKRG